MCVVAGVCMHARIGPTACVFSMMSSVVIVAIAGFRTQPPSLNMCALKAGFLRSFAASTSNVSPPSTYLRAQDCVAEARGGTHDMARALQPHLEQIWDRGACSSHRQIPRHSERRCTTCYSVQAPWLMRSEKLRCTLCATLPRPPRSTFWACTLRNARTAAIRRTWPYECTSSQAPFSRMRSVRPA